MLVCKSTEIEYIKLCDSLHLVIYHATYLLRYTVPVLVTQSQQQLKACLSYPNSVRPSVCLSHAGIVSKRIVMIFSQHDSPFILVFTADARFVGNSQLSCFISLTVCNNGASFCFSAIHSVQHNVWLATNII